jgi:hypothetical protein
MSAEVAVNNLIKAIEAGGYDAAPSTLVQGSALQLENMDAVIANVTFEEKHIVFSKMLSVKSCKSTLAQFDRQLSVGQFGGSAQYEGNVGQEETSDFVRAVVPMAFYSHLRRVTIASTLVDTVDGKDAGDRAAEDGAKKIAADIEFDAVRAYEGFSNAGVFDGANIPALPNMHGLDLQVRQSDSQFAAKDLMFSEYGSDESVVISAGGVAITQDKVEDVALRASLNFADSDATLCVDPVALAGYNRIGFGVNRIVLAGQPQEALGSNLNKQWTANGGTISLTSSNFLRGKYKPQRARANGPSAPSISTGVAGTTGVIPTGTYIYYATSVNETGESLASATASQAVTLGQVVTVTITHPGSGTFRYFNVYRTAAGGAAATAKFIGRVAAAVGASTAFTDLGNRLPGSTCGYLMQKGSAELKELAGFTRLKMAVSDLSTPEAFFRFTTLAVKEPRKFVILDNIRGVI